MPEYEAVRDPNREPMHPGVLLRDEVLPAKKLGLARAAQAIGVTAYRLRRILNEEVSISVEEARKIGAFCGNGARFWQRLQAAHDKWLKSGE